MFVAVYDIAVDGFRAQEIALCDRKPWHHALSPEAFEKLKRVGVLPCGTHSSDATEDLSQRILDYPDPV
jgi:hypothetical protein